MGWPPMSKYWTYWPHIGDMGLVSLVVCCWQMSGFLHYFFGWEWEGNWMGTRISVSWCIGDVVRSPVSQSNDSVQLCCRLVKGFYAMTAWDTYGQGPYADRVWVACGVLVKFACRVYINSNHRNFDVWVTAYLWSLARRKLNVIDDGLIWNDYA
jgi:hypothetical protein